MPNNLLPKYVSQGSVATTSASIATACAVGNTGKDRTTAKSEASMVSETIRRTFCILISLALIAAVPPQSRVTYRAIGASETVGFGDPAEQAYPYLLVRGCGLQMHRFAEFGRPALSQNVSPPAAPYIVSIFLGTNDIIQISPRDYTRRLHAFRALMMRAESSAIILAPDIDTIPAFANASGDLRHRQRDINRAAERFALTTGTHIIRLTVPTNRRTRYFLPDGLHPTKYAQGRIAAEIAAAIRPQCIPRLESMLDKVP